MQTTYFRDSQGWNGKTTVEMPGNQELIIETSRPAFGTAPPRAPGARRAKGRGLKWNAAGLAGTGDS